MNKIQALTVVGAMLGLAGSASAATYQIVDGSFESPNVFGGETYRPQYTDAIFTGNAAIDGGVFGLGTPPDGVQDGVLQSGYGVDTVISLNVYGLTAGDTYSFSFYDTQRAGYGINAYTVSVGGQTIYSGAPASTTFTKETTASFVAPAGPIAITFDAPDLGGDNDTGIDAITVNGAAGVGTTYLAPSLVSSAPEPASWTLMLVGVGAAGAAVRSRRKTRVA